MTAQVGVVDVYVPTEDDEMREFYGDIGFELIGRRNNFFEYVNTDGKEYGVHAVHMRYTLDEFSIWDLSFFEDTWIGRVLWKMLVKFYSNKWPPFLGCLFAFCWILFELNVIEYHIRACYLKTVPRTAFCKVTEDEVVPPGFAIDPASGTRVIYEDVEDY